MAADEPAEHGEAKRMLDICGSVGATACDVTWTNSAGSKERFQRNMSLTELRRGTPMLLDIATRLRRNVIVRPHGPGVSFIQLDDLNADKLATLPPAMFLALETSPGSFQAWLALPVKTDKVFARRVRKGAGADLSASGATRIAGSLNFKEKYAPHYPRVSIRTADPGRMTDAAELEQLGLVAPPDNFAPLPPARSFSARTWPSYDKALEGAPLNREGDGPDRSRADYVWCMTAITWGFSIEDTARRLMEESTKAREYGLNYARLTARNATLAVERRRQPAIRRSHG